MDNVNINVERIIYDNCEWCFQFDADEPYVFAAAEKSEDISKIPTFNFILKNTSDSDIIFTNNGKTFKLFARELTEDGKKLIKKDE